MKSAYKPIERSPGGGRKGEIQQWSKQVGPNRCTDFAVQKCSPTGGEATPRAHSPKQQNAATGWQSKLLVRSVTVDTWGQREAHARHKKPTQEDE